LTNDTNMVSLRHVKKEVAMNVTLKYMLRPVARCKEGCALLSRA